MFVWWTDIWFARGKSWFQEEADEALSQNSHETWAIAGCLFQATSWSGKHVHGRFQMSKSGSEQLLPRRRQAWETQLSCFPHSPKLCSNLCNFLNFEWQVNFSSKTFAIQLFKALTSYRHPPNMLPLLLSIYATHKACNRLLQKPRTQGAKCSAFTKHRKLGRPWLTEVCLKSFVWGLIVWEFTWLLCGRRFRDTFISGFAIRNDFWKWPEETPLFWWSDVAGVDAKPNCSLQVLKVSLLQGCRYPPWILRWEPLV